MKRAFWIVLAVAVMMLWIRSNAVPLLDPDESRFARTSVEMLRSGDLVVPHFQGEPRLVKPPLLHWIQSFVFRWFGATEWAARLHAALATLGSILLVGWVGRRRFGDEAGVWAATFLATMPLVLVLGRIGTLDALLAVHVWAAIAMDLAGPTDPGPYRALSLGGVLGLAFLVKGPVGVILPLLVMLAGRTASGREVLPSVRGLLRATAAWSLVVLPWGLAFLRRVGVPAVEQTLRSEALERYFAGTTHVEPPWFYGKVVAVGFLPWLAPLLLAIARTWRMRKDPMAHTARYAAAGLIAGLIFFSLGQSKLPNYLLPLAPLVAILVTWELGREIEAPRERTLGPTLLAATLGSCSVLLGLAGVFRLEGQTKTVALAGAVLYGAGAVLSGHGAIRRKPRRVYATAAATSAAFFLVVVSLLFPAIGRTKSAVELIDGVPQLTSGRAVVTVEMKVPSLTFYLDRTVEVLDLSLLQERLAAPDDPVFVFADVDLPACPAATMARLRRLGEKGKFVVFEKRD